jgi:hypothetical protein
MRNTFFAGLLAIAVSFLFSCGLHELIPTDDLSESKAIEAMKEALILGSKTAAANLGDSSCEENLSALGECTKGYLGNKLVEIALPDTVANVLDKISSFSKALDILPNSAKSLLQAGIGNQYNSISGLEEYATNIKTALNRGAELAAPNSIDVFKEAIFGMSFSDVNEILFGDSIAATSYLEATTYNGLKTAFAPIIKEPLDLLKPNKYWEPLASNYNSFANAYSNFSNSINSNTLLKNALGNSALPSLPYSGLPEDLSGFLAEYATGKALDGLFLMVGKQESKLRADPWGTVRAVGEFITDTVGELLGKVFSSAKGD